MIVFTIGYTKKSAEQFFRCLKQPRLLRVVDVRLKNVSQLAGFTKKGDLQFFLREICGMDYVHLSDLTPTKEIFDEVKKDHCEWSACATKFLDLLTTRRVEERVSRDLIDGGCLLCSEPTPEHCHRRLVAEYLRGKWGYLEIRHL